jgi:hypothetical protein
VGWIYLADCCEHGNNNSTSIKYVKFLDQLNYNHVFNKGSVALSLNNNNNNRNNNAENWYSHIPKPVTEHEDITVLWNQGIQTDREVLTNRPDIIIKNKKDKTCLLIYVAIP